MRHSAQSSLWAPRHRAEAPLGLTEAHCRVLDSDGVQLGAGLRCGLQSSCCVVAAMWLGFVTLSRSVARRLWPSLYEVLRCSRGCVAAGSELEMLRYCASMLCFEAHEQPSVCA
jgi:hypothetical protein